MNCIEIVRAYLIREGYDGLAGHECGCTLGEAVKLARWAATLEADYSQGISIYQCRWCGDSTYRTHDDCLSAFEDVLRTEIGGGDAGIDDGDLLVLILDRENGMRTVRRFVFYKKGVFDLREEVKS